MADDDIDSQVLEKYEIVEKLGKGAYGMVWKVIQKKTKKVFALKKICNSYQNSIDAQRTYRELHFLNAFNHDNIISIHGAASSKNGKDLYLILEYMESDLHHVIRAKILQEKHIKYIAFQILKALKYIHSGHIVHRDIKPSNILINPKCHAKLADFGMARSLDTERDDDPIILTEYVATRWYRAPEILFGSTDYTKASDMWSFGCLLAEMILGKVLFPGSSTLNQIEKILEYAEADNKKKNVADEQATIYKFELPLEKSILSSITVNKTKSINSFFPNVKDEAIDLLRGILQLEPEKRLSLEQTMKHKWLAEIREKMQDDGMTMPRTFTLPLNDNKKFQISEYTNSIDKKVIAMRKLEYRDENEGREIQESHKSLSRSIIPSLSNDLKEDEQSYMQLKNQNSITPQSTTGLAGGLTKQQTMAGTLLKEKTISNAQRSGSLFGSIITMKTGTMKTSNNTSTPMKK